MHDPSFDPMPELAVDEEPFTLEELDTWTDPVAPAPPRVADFMAEPMSFGLAEWCMRHRVAIAQNEAALDAQFRDQVDRLERWHADARRRLARRAEFFEGRLTEYAAAHRALDPKNNKTTRLPSGEISSTERKPAAKIADEAAVVAWAKGRPDADVLTVTPDPVTKPVAAAIKKAVSIAERVVEREALVTLANGDQHRIGMLSDEPPVSVGETIRQDDGMTDAEHEVIDVEVIERTALVVVDEAGEPVPGVVVVPTEITFTVRPTL